MRLLKWFSQNWADTSDDGDSSPLPLTLPLPRAEVINRIESIISTMPRWNVVKIDHDENTLHLTRTTRVFRFVDDIHLRLEERDGKTTIHGRSQSRIGKGDLGQNARNLRGLFAALQT